MMDLKFKGPKWVGNIYQKFEAICHEVDDIVKQDTIKYVENQMHSVGKNVKKLCSDLLPPLGHPVKHVAEDVVIEKNATVSTKTTKSFQEKSVDATEKQSSTEPNIIDPVTSQPSLASSEHHLGDQLSSLTSMDTLEKSDPNLSIGKVDDILTNENSAADKPILSKLTSPGGEEHIAESSVHSKYENRQADFSEVETSTDELEQKSRRDNFSAEVECVSGVSTVMVSNMEPKVMDPENQLNLVSCQSHLLEQLSSPTSMDTHEGSESILCMGKIDGILTDENSDANKEEFSTKEYAPILPESTSSGVVEHITMSPIGVSDQSNDENKHAVLSKFGPETPVHEGEFESLQNWTLWDDYVDEIECVSGALNSTSEMSFSVVSAENTTEDVGLASFSGSNAKESLRISENSPEKLTQESMFCHNSVEGVSSVTKFSDVAHETSAHSLEFESQLDSTAWDNFADETECNSGGSNTTSEMVSSVVSGENSIEEVGLTSFNCSNAKPLRVSEDSPQKLSTEAMLCHNSSEVAGCVCDMSEVVRDNSAHGVESEFQLRSPAWDECSDDIQCVSGASKDTSEVACSVVPGENAAAEIGLPSFGSSNAKEFLKFTENSPQMLSVEAMFCHSSGGYARCVSDSSDGFSSSAPALTVSSKTKDTEVRLSSFSSVLSIEEGTSRITETMPLTVPSGKQQVKICESVQHEAVVSSADTGCLDESSSDIAYCHMESIDLHDKVKIEESCVNVEDSVLHAISRRARKQRSYKKQIQDAFTSKKRLVKEYEQLAIWFGDTGLDSSQEATSNEENSGTHHAGDSEWELL
ncbi:hypothetical protein ABKV19_005226 [Rosa sericea]